MSKRVGGKKDETKSFLQNHSTFSTTKFFRKPSYSNVFHTKHFVVDIVYVLKIFLRSSQRFVKFVRVFMTFEWNFCPAGPLGRNFGQKYTIFCPTGPLDGNFDKRFTTFIWIFFKPPVSICPNPALHASNSGGSIFPKPATRASNPVGGSIFEEPALQAAMPQNQGSQFLKSRRFTPQNRRGGL